MCNCALLMLNGLYIDSSETVHDIQKNTILIYENVRNKYVIKKCRSGGFNC